MSEAEKRKKRCCFTGHRPEKLSLSEYECKELLNKAIRKIIADGFIVFISGMARGVDIWAAEIVIKLRDEEHLPIKLIAASPFEGFEERWPEEWRKRYHKLLEKADLIRYISPHYYTGCFQVRNEWMIE